MSVYKLTLEVICCGENEEKALEAFHEAINLGQLKPEHFAFKESTDFGDIIPF